MLPILHLNGYKIANPTVLARIGAEELHSLFVGYGYKPYLVEGDDPAVMHQLMAATLDEVLDEIRAIQADARDGRAHERRPTWPMIILKTPKGWTGPKEVDGLKTEGFWRSHQVPIAEMATKPEHVKLLENWMKSYRPEELFDADGALRPEIAALAPAGDAAHERQSACQWRAADARSRSARHRRLCRQDRDSPASSDAEATAVMAEFLRDVMRTSEASRNFRVFGPDETASNRLSHVFEATDRAWDAETLSYDDHLAPERPGDGDPVANIPARAGSKAIC